MTTVCRLIIGVVRANIFGILAYFITVGFLGGLTVP